MNIKVNLTETSLREARAEIASRLKTAEEEVAKLKSIQANLNSLTANSEVEYDLASGTFKLASKDNRHVASRYFVRSESGNSGRLSTDSRDHEVLYYTDGKISCNCPAGRFGKRCHAIDKVVDKSWNYRSYSYKLTFGLDGTRFPPAQKFAK